MAAPGMRRTPEQRRVQLAELEVVNSLDRMQSQLNLSDLEMFEANQAVGVDHFEVHAPLRAR